MSTPDSPAAIPPPGAELPEARAWADGVAFLQAWRGPFLAAVGAAHERAAVAAAATARAGRLLAPHRMHLEVTGVVASPGDDVALLAALELKVADLEAFEAAVAARARVGAWLERAGADGPLGHWAADARIALPDVDRRLDEGDTDAIVGARAALEGLVRGVDEARGEAGRQLAAVRAAARDAGDTFAQATRILGEDVKRLELRLSGAAAEREDAEGVGPGRVLIGAFSGAGFGAVLGFVTGGPWTAMRAGAVGLCVGLVAGLGSWARRSFAAAGALAAVREQAEELRADVEQARVDVLHELDAVRARWEGAVAQARALDLSAAPLDTASVEGKVREPGATAGLDALLLSLRRQGDPLAAVRIGGMVVGGGVLGPRDADRGKP